MISWLNLEGYARGGQSTGGEEKCPVELTPQASGGCRQVGTDEARK